MQSQPLNPFPMSDKDKEDQAKLTPVAPMPAATPALPTQPAPETPAPAHTAPTPAATPSPLFVQPAANDHTDAARLPGPVAAIEKLLSPVFSHPAIQMPELARDIVARALPWLTLIGCLMLAPLVLIGVGMGGFLGFITSFYVINSNAFYWVTVVLLLAELILMGFSIPKLLNEKRSGWNLLFITTLVGAVCVLSNLFAQFVQPVFGILAGLIAFALVMYLLFQTRSYYSN